MPLGCEGRKEGKTSSSPRGIWKCVVRNAGFSPVSGTLIQRLTDPLVFYSFGPWKTLDDVDAMRKNENVRKAMSDIIEHCQKARPGNYKQF